MITRILIICTCVCLLMCSPKGNIPYPQPLPDTTALRFLPDIVSSDALDFNAVFSPDGRSFYFSRTINNQWDILVSHYDGAAWTEPVVTPFCEQRYAEADPVFAPDGKLYFISDRHDNDSLRKDHDIWMTELLDNGAWSDPQNVTAVNSDSSEYYVAFAANGNLYFGSSRAGGFGEHDIYVSRYNNGNFLPPENLGPQINTVYSEHDPCLAEDESFLILKSENREDGFGSADLYYSLPDKDGWTEAVNLGDNINTPTYEYCPYLTPDGEYFFFSSEQDVKWISTKYLKGIMK